MSYDTNFQADIIFDVGANVGEVTADLYKRFPNAHIFAFEPAQATFDALASNFAAIKNVSAHQIAFDIESGVQHFTNTPGSKGNKIVHGDTPQNTIEVEVATGDEFCASQGIEKIDFLKVDTEGYDMRVISGFTEMFKRKKVKYIQVECTTSLDNRFHVHLERFIHFLHPFGYRLFGIYDPDRIIRLMRQRMNGIWYCNAVFVAEVESPRLRRDGMN